MLREVIILLILLSTLCALASTPSVGELKRKLSDERNLLLNTELKKRTLLGDLYQINKDLSKASADLMAVTQQVDMSKKSINRYAKEIATLERVTQSQKKLLSTRLRAIYKIGVRGYTEALLSSQTTQEFSRNIKFLRIITLRDHELIKNYELNLSQMSLAQGELKDHVKVYLQSQSKLGESQKIFSDQKSKQVALLTLIERDRETHLEAIREWREAGKKFEEKLVSLGLQPSVSPDFARGTFFESKGELKQPVAERILQRYGIVKDSKFDTKIFHKGLFFAVVPGENVESVFPGKVAFTGWINGYGETVIIDHGDHYYTVYAHNSKIEKKIGDNVNMGESVARAGDTGSLRGPGLYFEIRHFSESLDPSPWLDLQPSKRL
jgi:septal ring factor EnvC (AmiA/AmiB activator)